MLGELVTEAIPRFEKFHVHYDDLRQRFPAQRERWRIELQKMRMQPNEIDALLNCKTARSAAIHYVAKKLGLTPHTVQNAYSIFRKTKSRRGRVRTFPQNLIRETEIPQIPQNPRKAVPSAFMIDEKGAFEAYLSHESRWDKLF